MTKKNDKGCDCEAKEQNQIRELKIQVKALQKRLKKARKDNPVEFEEDSEGSFKPSQKQDKIMCSECGKGQLEEVLIVNRKFYRCNTCDFRTRAKRQ